MAWVFFWPKLRKNSLFRYYHTLAKELLSVIICLTLGYTICQQLAMVPSNSKLWDFCALFAGTLYTLSFSPFDVPYLDLAALIFIIVSCIQLSPGRAFLRGYCFGLGIFGLGVSWVFISIHGFGGANIFASIFLTSLFVAFWALFPALAAFLSVILPVKRENNRILIFSIIWILVEYLRGNLILNGFPWLQIAYSYLDSPLAGYIPVLGAYGTGFIVALTASILVIIYKSRKRLVLLTVSIVVLWAAGFVLKTIRWTHEIGPPIEVALIQGNISQDQKWRPENRMNTLMLYKAMTEQHWDADVVVWPESAIPAYLDEVRDFFLLPLSEEARRHHADLIISVPAHGETEEQKFNAVITLGKNEGMYRKIHLLPFGEYLPWRPISGFILKSLKVKLGNFTPGTNSQPLLIAGGQPFLTSICYEDVFGEGVIKGLPEAAYLVNVTNDGWFGDSVEPHQHMQLARMRAIETGRFMLRATNTGLTAIVSPNGKIQGQAPLFKTTALTGKIRPMGGMTPYALVGDAPIILFILSLLCLIYILDKNASNRTKVS
jgi:apolipoprotein N-acyltransferase